MIEEFKGEYRWLSNFVPVNIHLNGIDYPSVEHAYMSAKSDKEGWKKFCSNPFNEPPEIKRKSRTIELVENWNDIKVNVMRTCLIQKFNTEPFKTKLLNTKNQYIQEGNYWNDKFWGVCLKTNDGENNLGKLIMEIRNQLKESSSWSDYISLFKENKEIFSTYSNFIDLILSEVFPDNHKTINNISGIYDLEKEGWSLVNKINTNMLALSILVEDINIVLRNSGTEEINLFNGDLPSELKRFQTHIDKFKHRIFNTESKTFKRIISALERTSQKGNLTESKTYIELIKKFGQSNVKLISGEGVRKDMFGGIDMEITVNGILAHAQIKPAVEVKKVDSIYEVRLKSTIKNYKTDWIIIECDDNIYIFSNKNSKIVEGNYVFDKNSLLYKLSLTE